MAAGPIFRFDCYEADARSGELRRSGDKLRIQEQSFQVLVALLERPGEVVTREELRQRLWPSDTFVDFDHGLNATINKLREVLGDSASNPRFIETLPRRGYRFLAAVESISAEPVAPVAADATPTVTPLPASAPASAAHHELPEIPQHRAALLFILLQVMYVIFYIAALANLDEAGWRMQRSLGVPARAVGIAVIVSACIGLALRLYTLAAAAFRYRFLGRNFRRIFPAVLVIDILWAFSPFFLIYILGIGLAFAACAALVYAPFAQRVLALLAYPPPQN